MKKQEAVSKHRLTRTPGVEPGSQAWVACMMASGNTNQHTTSSQEMGKRGRSWEVSQM